MKYVPDALIGIEEQLKELNEILGELANDIHAIKLEFTGKGTMGEVIV